MLELYLTNVLAGNSTVMHLTSPPADLPEIRRDMTRGGKYCEFKSYVECGEQ